MKKILSMVPIILSLLVVMAPAVFASGGAAPAATVSGGAATSEAEARPYINDYAGLLTEAQTQTLEAKAAEISTKYKCGVYIVVVNDMYDSNLDINYAHDGGDAYVFNKTFYERYGLGYGAGKSGLLLCLSMADRDYWLEPYGYGRTAFTQHGIDVMLDDNVLPWLAADNWYQAFFSYLGTADEFLAMADGGAPFDKDTDPATMMTNFLIKLGLTIFIPLLIAFIVCWTWRSRMKTAAVAKAADYYIPEGGFNLTGQSDMFLYRTVTQMKIKRESSSGGSARGSFGRGGKF